MRNITPLLNERLKSSQQTPADNADPKMSVKVSRARTTVMDSDYWTVETIRKGINLGDISLAPRRLKSSGPPDRIYEIHEEAGIIKTAIREYPDFLKAGWKEQFTLGSGSAVGIAFDGEWQLYRNRWRLVTHEKPWICWVDESNDLWVQLWDEEATKEHLATNVVQVRMIRAWKNLNLPDRDQGILVGYIKTDGKVYYRNYCIQEDRRVIWEKEREMAQFSGIAVNLNLFVTNDYRTGVVIEDNQGKIHWFITKRNWVGMAITPDKFFARATAKVGFLEVKKTMTLHTDRFCISPIVDISFRYANSFNAFKTIENVNDGEGQFDRFIVFSTKHRILDLNPLDFVLVDSKNSSFAAVAVSEITDRCYQLEMSSFNNAIGQVRLVFKGLFGTNEAGSRLDEFEGIFTPINLVPDNVPPPEVEAIWNE